MSDDAQQKNRSVCVTGPAGAGRQTARRSWEDLGYAAIDNLPLRLVDSLIANPSGGQGTALGLDPRSREFSTAQVLNILDTQAHNPDAAVDLLYLDCATETLMKRFSETRRKHPLSERGTLDAAIQAEKDILHPLKPRASVLLDTSELTIHDLRAQLDQWFAPSAQGTLNVAIHSFSFKRGLPFSADMVFDCRFLRNPFWEPTLREKTGLDPEIQSFVSADSTCAPFEARVHDLVLSLLPEFVSEGKSHLSVAFGCTGGKHRSVTIAERCAVALAEAGWRVSIKHRDLDRSKRDGAAN